MTRLRLTSFLVIYFIYILPCLGQTVDSTVVTAFGIGDTESDALYNAKINAIGQVFSSYISTNAELINDSIAVNKITSINNGNVQKFEILKTDKSGNGYYVTIRAYVNLKNTIQFCKSLGYEAMIQGDVMSDNLSIKLKNIESEKHVFESFFKVFKTELPNFFNYNITVENPVKATNTNNFLTRINSSVTLNDNFNSILNILVDLISDAGLPAAELPDYKRFNLDFYPVFVQTNEKTCYGFLRSKESIKILIKYFTIIDEAIQNHVVTRNDGKEIGPTSILGPGFNIFFYLYNNQLSSYQFFSTVSQPVSIGKMAFKCQPGEEMSVTNYIKGKYAYKSCFAISDSVLLNGAYTLSNLVYFETPFFYISSTCNKPGNQYFKFVYNDWVSLEELKSINKYSLKFQ